MITLIISNNYSSMSCFEEGNPRVQVWEWNARARWRMRLWNTRGKQCGPLRKTVSAKWANHSSREYPCTTPSACSLSMFCHPFMRLLFIYIFFFCTFLIASLIDMSCKLFVRVSDQYESLCYSGHWAHFILAMYCYISFFFLIDVISVILLML